MDKRGNDPLQEELRSSQVYKTLKGSGIPMAGKLAEGLGKAAQGLDQALNLGRGSGQAQGGHPYQAPPQQSAYRPPQNTTQTRQAPPPSGSAQPGGPNTAGPAGNGYYHYSYRKSGQAPPPPQQTPPPVYQPQTKAQRQAAANRAAAARQAAKQQAAAAKQAAKQGAAQQANAQQVNPQVPMKMVRRGSPAKFYITAAAALVYATSAPLYEPYHFVIFAAVLVLVFLGSSALFKGKKEFVPIQPEKPKEELKKEPEKEEKSHTGNPEVDKIIDEGREYLKKLRAADDAIPDEMIEAASIDGAEGIPEKWKAPLGDKIVTMCIDKTWGGIWVPQTCTELAERVMRVTPGFLGAELCDVLNPDGYTIRCADELYCLNQTDYQPRMNGSGKDHHLPVRELARLGSNILRKEYPAFEVLVNLQGDPYFKHGENRRFSVTVRNCFEMRRQEWARITLHAPDGMEILSGKEIMLPLNNLWGACAEAEFEFNADFYPSAKLELLVDVQQEGHHSYGVVKVVVTRKG